MNAPTETANSKTPPAACRRSTIAPGVYIDGHGRYWARPRINRRSTWRLLKDAQDRPITNAKKAVALALNKDWRPSADDFSALAKLYIDADCPNKRLEPRGDEFCRKETKRLELITQFFGHYACDDIRLKHLPAYAAFRKRHCQRGTGERTIDLDLATLSNVLNYGVAIDQLEMNWIAHNRPRYRKARDVKHSREKMPASADVIHQLADHFFSNVRSELAGWLTLFAMFTHCRTSELLRLRTDATNEQQPGFDDGKHLWLGRRSKNGINPKIPIGPEFRSMLDAFNYWKTQRHPKSPWYFPGRYNRRIATGQEPANKFVHVRALARACKELGLPHTTPHAFRAYGATKLLREKMTHAEVAARLGDKTPMVIAEVYGDHADGDPLYYTPATGLPAWLKWQPPAQKIARIA